MRRRAKRKRLFSPALTAASESLELDTHRRLFMAGFLGRGFDSRRLHHFSILSIAWLAKH
jgi:hypothetical protein